MINVRDAINLICSDANYSLLNGKIYNWKDERPQPTEEEINAKIAELEAAEPLRLLRIQRDQLLSQTDYITLRAYSQGQAVPQEWADYMQALRDLPSIAEPQLDENGNLTNVEWPTKPE